MKYSFAFRTSPFPIFYPTRVHEAVSNPIATIYAKATICIILIYAACYETLVSSGKKPQIKIISSQTHQSRQTCTVLGTPSLTYSQIPYLLRILLSGMKTAS